MSQIWHPEEIAGRILYGETETIYGNGYFGALDWYDKSISTQTYSNITNPSVSYSNLDSTTVTYTEETLGPQTWN